MSVLFYILAGFVRKSYIVLPIAIVTMICALLLVKFVITGGSEERSVDADEGE
jgi:hypothetical protein